MIEFFDFESGFELIVDNNLYNLDLSYGLLEFSTDGSFIKNNIPETSSLTNTGNFTVSDFTIYQENIYTVFRKNGVSFTMT